MELHCRTNYSFLEGASHPDELVIRAAELGLSGLAVTDRNSLAGVVRAHVAAKEVGCRCSSERKSRPLMPGRWYCWRPIELLTVGFRDSSRSVVGERRKGNACFTSMTLPCMRRVCLPVS